MSKGNFPCEPRILKNVPISAAILYIAGPLAMLSIQLKTSDIKISLCKRLVCRPGFATDPMHAIDEKQMLLILDIWKTLEYIIVCAKSTVRFMIVFIFVACFP
jgi:hypothetical protein